MKTALRLLFVSMCLCGAVPLMLVSSGCTTPVSQRQTAYDSLRTVGMAVDTAMRAYADAVVAGAVTPDQQSRVKDTYGKYRVAYIKAIDVAKLDLNAAPPAEVAQLAAEIVTLVATFAKH